MLINNYKSKNDWQFKKLTIINIRTHKLLKYIYVF